MALDPDDEILQDFLVEAGEILEQLNEQLVDLEQQPDDYDLLNAVFRGFHTVKGGAGFLGIDGLVEVCHRAEDVFNILRQGQRTVDAELMDAVLKVLDVVNEMFTVVQGGQLPEPADRELIATLQRLAQPADAAESAEPEPAAPPPEEPPPAEPAAQPEQNLETADDEITEDEFEALLDQLHGKGKHGGVPKQAPPVAAPPKSAKSAAPPPARKPPEKPAAPEKKEAADGPKKAVSTAETTVRVDTARLDDIMNMVGELVLVRNRLANLRASMADEKVATAVANLDLVTSDLQNSVMKTRMLPVKKVFGRFPRVVRDLARSLNKEIELEMHGEETDLDKNLVEALADPMVHLVRNSVDHGIEMPDEREKAGKPRKGTVILSAAQEGNHIVLTIEDDGKGMDPDVFRAKAVEKGMMDAEAAARLDNKDCYNLIFQPGFSTKTEISDISGRGVGMDVVKTGIAKMNGSVEIDSELGKGSQITIKLPLTLAILPTLMVLLDQQPFALPLASVVEIFNLDLNRTNVVDGQLTIMVRERALPLFYLRKWLIKKPSTDAYDGVGHVVVVNVGGVHVGLVVDHLIGQEEVVIKSLGATLQGVAGMAGATITGDGKIALILDVPGLLRKYARKY